MFEEIQDLDLRIKVEDCPTSSYFKTTENERI